MSFFTLTSDKERKIPVKPTEFLNSFLVMLTVLLLCYYASAGLLLVTEALILSPALQLITVLAVFIFLIGVFS